MLKKKYLILIVVLSATALFWGCQNPLNKVNPSGPESGQVSVSVTWPEPDTDADNIKDWNNSEDQVKSQNIDFKKVKSRQSGDMFNPRTIGYNVDTVNFELTDSEGRVHTDSAAPSSGTATVTFPGSGVLPSGEAAIEVKGYDSSSNLLGGGNGTLTIPTDGTKTTVTVKMMDRFNWQNDNTSSSSAEPISSGTLYEDLSIHESGNEDWYKLSVINGSIYTIDTYNGLYVDVDNIVEIYDSGLSLIAEGDGLEEHDIVTFTASSTEEVFIKVSGATEDPTGNYTLSIEESQVLTERVLYEDTIDSIDNWYEIFVNNDYIDIDLFFDHSDADIDLRLYDSSLTELDTSASVSDNEYISYEAPGSGDYYIRVSKFAGTDGTPYRLWWDDSPAGGSHYSGSLTTTFGSNNSQDGNMFDIVTSSTSVTINGIDCNVDGTGDVTIEVWYRTDTYVGHSSSTGWVQEGTYTVTPQGTDNPTSVDIGAIDIPANSTYGIYLTTTGTGSFEYTDGANTYTDGIITINTGYGNDYQFGSIFDPRTWNGTVYYDTP